jgi:hypothetical protein
MPFPWIFRRARRAAIVGAVVLTLGESTMAKDFCLIIGGGYDPSGNPASLERNVQFGSAVLAAKAPGMALETYFADGDDPQRDVQYVDEAAVRDCPASVRIMAELFDEPRALGFEYRDHRISDVAGPTNFDLLEQRFGRLARELKSGDRLIIYAAGHGGEAYDRSADAEQEADANDKTACAEDSEDAPELTEFDRYQTSLLLWNQEEVTTTDFVRWLDALPRDVQVVLVMVQCYSGGFAHAIFESADVKLGLSPARRCGFFSQLHDRAAAGCVAELDEQDVEEYSTYFWAALGGKSRTGDAVDADYDRNGAVSLAEAHAFAVIESDTIDVPTRTSEALLRAYSRLGGPFEVQESDAVRPDDLPALEKGADLLEPSGPLAELAARARPDQRAILESLADAGNGNNLQTVEEARIQLEAELEDLDEALDALDAAMDNTDAALLLAQNEAYARWPELYYPNSTAAAELLAEHAEVFASVIEPSPSYAALHDAREQEDRLTEARDEAERRAARLERLLRTIENVVLAENLPRVASPEIVARYRALIAMEEQGL